MAKLSSVNKNERRKKLVKKYANRYAKLKAVADDQSADDSDRLMARLNRSARSFSGSLCVFTGRMANGRMSSSGSTTMSGG